MIEDTAVELTEEDLQGVEFSDAQKLHIQTLIQERLGRATRAAEIDKNSALEGQRKEFQKHLPGSRATPIEQRLAAEANKMESDKVELERLSLTFGNKPGASLRAGQWFKEDPISYRAARERYRVLSGHGGAPPPLPQLAKSFH